MQKVKNVFSRFGFAQLVGGLAILLISVLMIPLTAADTLEKLNSSFGPSSLLMLMYVPNIAFLLVFWLIIRKIPKMEWQKEPMRFASLVKAFAMMYAVTMFLNMVGTAVSSAAPGEGSQQLEIIDKVVNTKLPLGILITAVFAPILEELIFRKMMIDRLHNYGETAVIVFTALCFGLFHGNVTQLFYTTGVGLFLGYVYCKTGKIHYTIILHIVNNTLSTSIMLLLPLMQNEGEGAGGSSVVAVLGITLLMIVLVISGIILIILHLKRKDIVLNNSYPEAIPKGQVLKTAYLNPGMVIFLLYSFFELASQTFSFPMPF